LCFWLLLRAEELADAVYFMQYAAEVNSFLPRAVIPFVAWAAAVAETSCGTLLILGLWPRWVSLGSAVMTPRVKLKL
jgi:uncharacterized membrane protein YphA (DoxX/SURF4 family)